MRLGVSGFRVGVVSWRFLVLALSFGAALPAAFANGAAPEAEYRADQILVKPKAGVGRAALADFHAQHGARVLGSFESIGGVQVVALPRGETVPAFIAKYQQSGLVEYAEPDFIRHLNTTPNDPKFVDGTLWALDNYGQSGGTPHADIDATNAWDIRTSASNIVVAILDTGVNYTHEDLASNMWVNPVDGSHGTNAIAGTNDPKDDQGHGSLLAGILGAAGNNGKGVVGVAWQVQIMACKCFDSAGNGNDAAILACVDYARTNGAQIINASFDSTGFSQTFSNEIYATRQAGMLFVASCGNNAANIDPTPHYPACYKIDNVVSVGYTTRNDTIGQYSNYGATNVHLFAPGAAMYSTFFTANNSYLGGSFLEGTSLAAPYVVGSLALMLAQYPGQSTHSIIGLLLSSTDPVPALAGKCVTGGRLNLRKALSRPLLSALPSAPGGPFQLRVSAGTNRTCVIQAATDLGTWSPIVTNSTSSAGYFDFTDSQGVGLARRFYRAVAAP